MGVFLQRLNQQEVDRHPHRPTPIGIAAKHRHGTIPRAVGEGLTIGALCERIGMVAVHLGEGADPVGGEEFLFIKHPFTDPPQAILRHEGVEDAVVVPLAEVAFQPGGRGALMHKPGHAFKHIEHRQSVDGFTVETRHSQQRYQTRKGASAQVVGAAVLPLDHVVVKPILVIPVQEASF